MVVRGLAREEKYEGDIFQVQNGIKQLHKQMTMANVDIEEQQLRVALLDCRIAGKETNTELLRRYSRYVQSLSTITQDIERMRMEEELKGVRLIEINEGMRIEDSERVLRGQITQNKLLRNQIEQLVGHV